MPVGPFPSCWFAFPLCAIQTEGSQRRRRRRRRLGRSHPVSQLAQRRRGGGCKNTVTSRRCRRRRRRLLRARAAVQRALQVCSVACSAGEFAHVCKTGPATSQARDQQDCHPARLPAGRDSELDSVLLNS